jgi:hypothetical protein
LFWFFNCPQFTCYIGNQYITTRHIHIEGFTTQLKQNTSCIIFWHECQEKSGYIYLSNHGGVLQICWRKRSQYLPLKHSACDTFMVLFIDMFVYGVLTPLSTIFQLYRWRSVLLVEETRVPGENHQPVDVHWQTLWHNVVSSTPHHEQGSNSQLFEIVIWQQGRIVMKRKFKQWWSTILPISTTQTITLHIFLVLSKCLLICDFI